MPSQAPVDGECRQKYWQLFAQVLLGTAKVAGPIVPRKALIAETVGNMKHKGLIQFSEMCA